MPEEEEESAKLQSKKGAADVTRGSNILNKVVTRLSPLSLSSLLYSYMIIKVVSSKELGHKSQFTAQAVPVYGVFTDHEAELGKVCFSLINLN